MCGIAGIICHQEVEPEARLLEEMKSLIAHRGPDGSGIYHRNNVGLVHTRLSIQDLSEAAHQPMIDPSSNYCISFNGEIYNFPQLREELMQQGITFESSGDTEVLLKACIHYGVEATLPKLNGMFAFAFWNNKTQELWLARDRMGIKPLYFTSTKKGTMFASEIKALVPFMDEVKPDISVLFEVLSGGTVWEPNSMVHGVNALNPGSYIRISNSRDKIVQKEYFSVFSLVDESTYATYNNASLQDMSQEFMRLMQESVKIHAISDAPLATLVSGGIDSSLISALTNQYCPGISLYHADVVGEQSEKKYAKQVADFLKLDFVCAEMNKDVYVHDLVVTTLFHETPSAYHPNDVPFQLIAKRAHQDGIKVLLTGEGADELFIGYGHASKEIIRNKLRHVFTKGLVLGNAGRLINKIYGGTSGPSMIENLATRGTSFEWKQRSEETYRFIKDPVEKQALISSNMYQKAHLNSLLQRNDRMGMMHGLESRIPFLENEMVKFAVNLPLKFKHPHSFFSMIAGNPLTRNKTVVRRAARNLVPDSITTRKKLGFPITPEHYIHLQDDFFEDGFLQETLRISNNEVKNIFNNLSSDSRWNLFSTELYGKLFFCQDTQSEIEEKIRSYMIN